MNVNIKKIFNWEIVDVSRPIPSYVFTCARPRVSGYTVTITYAHHGCVSKFFDAESEALWARYPDDGPWGAAYDYYKRMKNSMRQQHKRMR